ncbi:MAG: hypothetical protein UY72_C0057G0008 [Candidatus Uhrbacteria bacterium GW2011_GWD2_52_7]|uniref:Uncharacterized protein n=1 Tax=Candidatus Uhrbacteria bacterium GW2011_GWD2_52_7 TaxID=1618989 RepID=A0A0G2A9D0_9BACT|nr:MAG: hypothetical protein UY72_C0057G0008 [Candidatus Uhrbacteria bacterium GW2011_GWD2_52_7]
MEHPVAEEARLRDIDALAREFERDREALEAEMARYDDESLSPREREEMGLAPKKKVKK